MACPRGGDLAGWLLATAIQAALHWVGPPQIFPGGGVRGQAAEAAAAGSEAGRQRGRRAARQAGSKAGEQAGRQR